MNRLNIHFVYFLLLLLPTFAHAQTTIKGQVKDEKGGLMTDVSVVITGTADTMQTLGYAFTDVDGNYSIQLQSEEKQIKITYSGFNIQKKEVIVSNHSATVNQIVKEESINLREVSIKADKIWQQGDTLNYNVNSFLTEGDMSIGEVLKRMPGITVKPSGAIEYKGRSISNFYIEGMDLLKGRYGIATNNISPSSISTVQVLENHQEVKALQNLEFKDAAAINLKLKDSAKGIFNISAQLGLGTEQNMLWENEAIGTYFTRKRQHLITYKSNNNGTDLSKELTALINDDLSVTSQFIQMEIPSPPGIELSKYYFNNTNAATANNIWQLSTGDAVNINIIYINDHERRNSYAQTTYMMPDRKENVITEQMSSTSTTDRMEGTISYSRNRENNYLAEDLSFFGEWERGLGEIFSKQSIKQLLRMKTFQASNKLHWIKKKDEYKGVEINSHSKFESKPQKLYVQPCLFNDLFPEENVTDIRQAVTSTDFISHNSISLLTAWMMGDVRISPNGIVNLKYSELSSNLSPLKTYEESPDKMLRNNTSFFEVESGVSLQVDYNIRGFNALLRFPVTYNYNDLKQKMQNSSIDQSKVIAEPYASISYKINQQWEIGAKYNRIYGRPNMQQLYGGYILTNYRNLTNYEASLDRAMFQSTNFDLNYKDLSKMLFTGLSMAYTLFKPHILYGHNIDQLLSRMITHKTDKNGSNWHAGFRFSKGIFWKSLNMEFEAAWNQSETPILRQEEEVYYLSRTASVAGKAYINLFEWLFLNYEGVWQWNKSGIKRGGQFPINRTLSNKANAKVTIMPNLTLSGSLDNYYNNRIEGNKSFTMVDMDISYKWKNTVFTLLWSNIFDLKEYTYSYTNSMNQYYSEYKIRPSSIMLTVKFNLL